MSTFAVALISLLVGMLAGVILTIKLNLGVDNIYTGKVRFRQSGRGNVQDTDINADLTPQNKPERRKLFGKRKSRKLDS